MVHLEAERAHEAHALVGVLHGLADQVLAGDAEVRGAGLMIGVDLGERPGAAVGVARALLEQGFIVSTGGGRREVLVLTPPLVIGEDLLHAFVAEARSVLGATGP